MMRYFNDPDSSFDASLQRPLKELDFNESTGSYVPLSPKKTSLKDDSNTFSRNRKPHARPSENKENRATDADKLPVYHRGQHGEQLGTLIVRHHAQKDSKCIQCRNCGIFFTVACFLKHCHDQYGKRASCDGARLQLGVDRPTSQQKEAWGNFQRKLLSEKSDVIAQDITRVRNSRYQDERTFQSRQISAPPPLEKTSSQRTRRSSVEVASRCPTDTEAHTKSSVTFDNSLFRSRKFVSSSALFNDQPSALSLSQLGSNGIHSSSRNLNTTQVTKATTAKWLSDNENPADFFAPRVKPDNYKTSCFVSTPFRRGDIPDLAKQSNRYTSSQWGAPKSALGQLLMPRSDHDVRQKIDRDTSKQQWDQPISSLGQLLMSRGDSKSAVDFSRNSSKPDWDVPEYTTTQISQPMSRNDRNSALDGLDQHDSEGSLNPTNNSLFPNRSSELSRDVGHHHHSTRDITDAARYETFAHGESTKPSSTERFLEPDPKPIFEAKYDARSSEKTGSHQSNTHSNSCDDDSAGNLIKNAISMLEDASRKFRRETGNNSNAWRKMYEEERDHRMTLEAKVRDLERELRSKS